MIRDSDEPSADLPDELAYAEGDATTGDDNESCVDLDSACDYSESLNTNSSFVDSLADDYSFATTATSLTSIEDATGLGNSLILPFVFLVAQ